MPGGESEKVGVSRGFQLLRFQVIKLQYCSSIRLLCGWGISPKAIKYSPDIHVIHHNDYSKVVDQNIS